jgi:hypothetical protein
MLSKARGCLRWFAGAGLAADADDMKLLRQQFCRV